MAEIDRGLDVLDFGVAAPISALPAVQIILRCPAILMPSKRSEEGLHGWIL